MWRRILVHNIREVVSFRGRCRHKNANPMRTGFQMWYGLIRLAKRWSPHIGGWWSFLQGLLYQRCRLLQEINWHKCERLRILFYIQTTKATCLWSALLWHRLNAISKSFCTVKGFTNRFIARTLWISHNPLFTISVKQWVVWTQECDWTAWFNLSSKSAPFKGGWNLLQLP